MMNRRAVLAATALTAFAVAGSSAFAAWTHVMQAAVVHGTVETLTVPTATAPVTTTTSNKTITISWNQSKTSSSNLPASSYVVSRSDAPATAVCTVTVLTCTNTVTNDGNYSYTVKALYQSWSRSSTSGTVTVDSTGPAVTITSPATDGTTITGASTSFAGGVGTATRDVAAVTVTVLSGASTVATPTATVTGSTWSTPSVSLSPGSYTVRAVQSDSLGNSTTVNRTFSMAAAVGVSGVSPSNRGQGAAGVIVNITGNGFTGGAGLTANFGSNTTTTSVVFVSSTLITATVAVAANATTGQRNFTVTLGGSGTVLTCTNCFTVNAAPTVTMDAVTLPRNGAQTAVTVSGTNFVSGFTPTITGSTNYAVISS
jgi:hypothetical protein